MLVALVAMTMAAKEIPGKLTVTINGNSMSQDATVTLDQNEDETYNFSILNFVLKSEEDGDMGVGNIILENLPGLKVATKTTSTFPLVTLRELIFGLAPCLMLMVVYPS